MKQPIRLIVLFCACATLALTAAAGPEPISSGKEMKQVAPAPVPECNWTGFYIGLNAGGQFGHSETTDEHFDAEFGKEWGYSESGFTGGAQFGYNFQWHWLVTGPEFDIGYMDLQGSGDEFRFSRAVVGETDSDFYTTLRGRVGVALDCWLIYATGGGIGVNYTTRYKDTNVPFDARGTDFNWGYTVGGGVERMLNPHWSIKAEYLYYAIGEQDFSGTNAAGTFKFTAETQGHIVRAGLNYKF